METVEVLVRIPKELYTHTQKHEVGGFNQENNIKIFNAIKNSTVLHKKHWIQQPRYDGDDQPDLVCPNCGFTISWYDMGNFCAKCGTGLEGGAG